MKRDINLFVKVFRESEHREQFLDGSLYMNTLKYFRTLKEEKSNNIADRHEGAYRVNQPHELIMTVNGINLDQRHIVGPIVFNMNWMGALNVFCMTHMHSHGILSQDSFDDEEYEKLKSYYKLADESYNLGDYAVIIKDAHEFLKRFHTAVDKLITKNDVDDFLAKPVEYYDDSKDSFFIDEFSLDSAFKKNIKFSHQSEYRIAISRDNPDCLEYRLEIGTIRDIAWVCKTIEVNKNLRVEAKK